jgi:phosphoribosylaminoimidazolecarboxamide formyltransferase/IMP cyclohydrolase
LADFKKMPQELVKSVSGGFLVQDSDAQIISKSQLKQVSKVGVGEAELEQLVFAMRVCKHVKSNAIVIANGLQTIGMGAGQTSRVDACEIACKKAGDKAKGAYLASDAFFPFADNIEIAAAYGIKAIVAPQGSIRDEEVIAAADAKKIALYFIETRHFKH